ncbi:MAG: hypothetical protein ACYTF1_11880, partial [Planctomycetota bacterium]
MHYSLDIFITMAQTIFIGNENPPIGGVYIEDELLYTTLGISLAVVVMPGSLWYFNWVFRSLACPVKRVDRSRQRPYSIVWGDIVNIVAAYWYVSILVALGGGTIGSVLSKPHLSESKMWLQSGLCIGVLMAGFARIRAYQGSFDLCKRFAMLATGTVCLVAFLLIA